MRQYWTSFNEQDRAVFRAIFAFLDGRLEEWATVDWALRLKPNDNINRLVLLDLIDSPQGLKLNEPWRSAWRFIEESWNNPVVEDHGLSGAYLAQQRLRAGDRSRTLVKTIVQLVAPRLKVDAFSGQYTYFRKPPKRPKSVKDLFSTRLTSGNIVDPNVLELGDLTDQPFLRSLALALDAAVASGMDIARRIGWDGEDGLWQLGQLRRVYYVPMSERHNEEDEPDDFCRGIAPSVKLLHAVVTRLVDVDISTAIEFVCRWKMTNSPVHLRLWAALSRDTRVTPATEVSTLLLSLADFRFWNINDFPELAELRSKRFSELEPHEQLALTARIRKRPPRKQWPRKVDADSVENARLYCAVRELRRIEIAGAALPKHDKVWLDTKIAKFPDLFSMVRFDEDFLRSPKAHCIQPNPDSRFDLLTGKARLKALETALSSPRGGWDDNPAERAADWIRQLGNPDKVLTDLESIQDSGGAFAKVWEWFGWAHTPSMGHDQDVAQSDLKAESTRVLSLLAKLPAATVHQAIEGISHWFSTWKKWLIVSPEALSVWLKLWPIAVDATNAQQPAEEEVHLCAVVHSSDDSKPMDLDTLNTPAGNLVGVFLAACPDLGEKDHPFDVDGALRTMRDTIIAANGRSGLIARHRMIEHLSYFLHAAPEWAQEHLITPLNVDNSEAIALWRAIARQKHFSNVLLKIIGNQMVERATDQRLGRESRRSLVFRLVFECLNAFRKQQEPAVPYVRIQQMLRTLDDEVRAYGAEAVQIFVRQVSAGGEGKQTPALPDQLFRDSAAPFLQQVWPQERSLATPGVSRALASLPATAQEAFAEAVDVIERFIVPFDCWTMFDYGLYVEGDGIPNISIIDNHIKAAALLRLLDLTIGTAEGSVIPFDLAYALDRIRSVAFNLTESSVFRRLATAARRE